jgi:hypothetical protein
LVALRYQEGWVIYFPDVYRDKEVVGVFVRFSCALQ